jgi:hypothetical protein
VRDLDGGDSNVFRREDLIVRSLLIRARVNGQLSLGLAARSVCALGEAFVMALGPVFLGLKFFRGLLEIFSHFAKLALFVCLVKRRLRFRKFTSSINALAIVNPLDSLYALTVARESLQAIVRYAFLNDSCRSDMFDLLATRSQW